MADVMTRARVVRAAVGLGVATGAYGVSFGALAITAGLSVLQTCVLSMALFSGASQFAFIAVIGVGGNPMTGAATATLLGLRNALYGLRLARLLDVRGARRAVAAQFVIDESTAMAIASEGEGLGRVGFWSTGLSIFVLWNLGTLAGALGAQAVPDPAVLGLDAAPPAAFVALLAPRLGDRGGWLIAGSGAAVALAVTPFVPAGIPVLCAAAVAAVITLWAPR